MRLVVTNMSPIVGSHRYCVVASNYDMARKENRVYWDDDDGYNDVRMSMVGVDLKYVDATRHEAFCVVHGPAFMAGVYVPCQSLGGMTISKAGSSSAYDDQILRQIESSIQKWIDDDIALVEQHKAH